MSAAGIYRVTGFRPICGADPASGEVRLTLATEAGADLTLLFSPGFAATVAACLRTWSEGAGRKRRRPRTIVAKPAPQASK